MIDRLKNPIFIKRFSMLTLVFALVHFALETLYTIQYGQTLIGLLPDYIASILLILGSMIAIKNSSALGILCGAWGFSFCLHYRAWAWRFEATMSQSATEVDQVTMVILGSTLVVSLVCFLITLLFCWSSKTNSLSKH